MFGIGFQEIIVILIIVLILFGPKRLPELARMIGKGLAEFRRAANDFKSAIELEEIDHYKEKDNATNHRKQDNENSSENLIPDKLNNSQDQTHRVLDESDGKQLGANSPDQISKNEEFN